MSNHPNRNRRKDAPGRNPSPADVQELRIQAGYTQAEFGALVYKSERTVQDWESGARRMPPDTFEYISILIASHEARQARLELFGRPTPTPAAA